jgi:hypothetical protein
LILERGEQKIDAVVLEGSPAFRVGSTDSTDSSGRFTITCTPTQGTPFGEVSIFAVARSGISESRRFDPAASDPFNSLVYSDSRIITESTRLVRSKGGLVLIQGQLLDSGEVPVPGEEVRLTSSFSDPLLKTTDERGFFIFNLRISDELGSWKINLSYDGNVYLGATWRLIEMVTFDGPSISLDEIGSIYVSGQVLFVNGTITGGEEIPQGNVNISFLLGGSLRPVYTAQAPIRSGEFSVPVTLDGGDFPPGEYVISASYEVPGIGSSDNSTLSFSLLGRTFIFVPEPEVLRGLDPLLFVQLLQGNVEPLAGGLLSVSFPEIPWLEPMPLRTNETGWAIFELDIRGEVPLGITPMRVEHLAGNGDVVPAEWEGLLRIKAPLSVEIISASEDLVVLDSVSVTGRLVDDAGRGIVGEDIIGLFLNGESIGNFPTTDGGWFDLKGLVPQFSRLGEGLLIVRFLGLPDNRSDWYSDEQQGIKVTVSSRTYIDVNERFFEGNSTVEISLKDERGESIPDAQLRVEIGFSLQTYITGSEGNVTLDLGEVSPGDELAVTFPGDPGRSLLPSNKTVEVPRISEDGDDIELTILLIIGVSVSLLIIAVFTVSRLIKARRDVATRKTREKRAMSRYPFDPRSTSQRMIVDTYRDVPPRRDGSRAPYS